MKPYFDLCKTPIEVGDIVYSIYHKQPMIITSGIVDIFKAGIDCYDKFCRKIMIYCDSNDVFPVYMIPQYRNYNDDEITRLIILEKDKKFKVTVPEDRKVIIDPIVKIINKTRAAGFNKIYKYSSTSNLNLPAKMFGKSYYQNRFNTCICNTKIKIDVHVFASNSSYDYIARLTMENIELKVKNDNSVEIKNPIMINGENVLESREIIDRLLELVDDCEKS